MANFSLRGLDAATLARLRSTARRRGISINRLIVDTLKQQHAPDAGSFDDLDALAGKWSRKEAEAFEAAVSAFGEIDPAAWAAEPEAAYRVRRRPGRKPGK